MKQIKKILKIIGRSLTRWGILNKRLLKKPSFVAILLLIPLLVGGLNVIGRKEKVGVMTIALAAEDLDPTAQSVIYELTSDDSLLNFIKCESREDAEKMLISGEVDAAWILHADFGQKLDKYVNSVNARNAYVTIIERESNILTMLSHEKLSSTLFPYISRTLYLDFVRDENILPDSSDESLLEFYDNIDADGEDLFIFSYAGGAANDSLEVSDMLLSPMRGLLALTILLCGLAAAIYYKNDELDGRFDNIALSDRYFHSLSYHLTAIFDMAVVVVLTLALIGLGSSIWLELIAILLLSLMVAGLCRLLGLIFSNVGALGALIPVITVACVALCPIFLPPASIPIIQYLLPPFYYLNAIYDTAYLWLMALYATVTFALGFAVQRIKSR